MKRNTSTYKNALITAILIILFQSITAVLSCQENPYIYMQDDHFMQGCNEFYPRVNHYMVDIILDANGEYQISPDRHYCNSNNSCSTLSCGENKDDWDAEIVEHLNTIVGMGFNTVRVVGLSVGSDLPVDGQEVLVALGYYEQSASNPNCYSSISPLVTITPYTYWYLGDRMAQLIQLIKDNHIELKLIWWIGGGSVENVPDKFSGFLA